MAAKISFEDFEFNDRLGEIIRMKRIIHVRLLVGDEMVTWIPIVFQRSSRTKIGSHRLNFADESANYLN